MVYILHCAGICFVCFHWQSFYVFNSYGQHASSVSCLLRACIKGKATVRSRSKDRPLLSLSLFLPLFFLRKGKDTILFSDEEFSNLQSTEKKQHNTTDMVKCCIINLQHQGVYIHYVTKCQNKYVFSLWHQRSGQHHPPCFKVVEQRQCFDIMNIPLCTIPGKWNCEKHASRS